MSASALPASASPVATPIAPASRAGPEIRFIIDLLVLARPLRGGENPPSPTAPSLRQRLPRGPGVVKGGSRRAQPVERQDGQGQQQHGTSLVGGGERDRD